MNSHLLHKHISIKTFLFTPSAPSKFDYLILERSQSKTYQNFRIISDKSVLSVKFNSDNMAQCNIVIFIVILIL